MAQSRLLVVDDEPYSVDCVAHLLHDKGFAIHSALGGKDGLKSAVEAKEQGQPFDVILVDYHMPDVAGVDVLKGLYERGIDSRVILMSAQESSDVAVEALKVGAFDFIAKPLRRAELQLRIERALRDRRAAGRKERLRKVRRRRSSEVIIGGSECIKGLYERIAMVAPTDVTVAISGESGTGKELVARTVHNLSDRHEQPFVAINCAAVPEALMETELFGHVRGAFTDASRDREGVLATAHTGTLFLDEIGEMSLSLQAKVLRVLQCQEFRRIGDDRYTQVDIRIITATNQDLEKAVRSGSFRQDLYYRINVFPIVLPPLRKRREDIPLLSHHFLLKHRSEIRKSVEGFSPAAIAKLKRYDFPGNVRELENKIHQALVLTHGRFIQPQHILLKVPPMSPLESVDVSRTFRDMKRELVERFEHDYVKSILRMHDGNLAAAARQAGMDRKNLWALAKKYSIDPNMYRSR